MLLVKLLLACLTLTSLEEKVGQLLMAGFEGSELNADARTLITTYHVGGIIFYRGRNGLTSPQQVHTLCHSLQRTAKIPLFMGIDQEGGGIFRIREGFTLLPSNRDLAEQGDATAVYAMGKIVGEEMKGVGLNMNFAPVVDVADREGAVIGHRSFGSDPQQVTELGGAMMWGLMDGGVTPVLKHFVGYGSATLDSHQALPTVEMSPNALVPFARLASEAPAMMTAHLRLPALDRRHCVTLSRAIITGLLREELGFDGVVITDSLTMHGVLEEAGSLEEAAIRAVEAGCDVLLIGGRSLAGDAWYPLKNAERIYHALLGAVRSGRLTEERIDESVERILRLKHDTLWPIS